MEHDQDTAVETALTDPTQLAVSSASRFGSPGLWIRVVVLTMLLNTTFFFRGCSLGGVNLTSGFPLPAAEFSYDDEDLTLQNHKDVPLLIDFVACFFGGILLALLTGRFFYSGSLAAGLLVTYAAYNLIVIFPDLWAKTVFQLQVFFLDLLFENERRIWVMDVFSRVYFALHTIACAILLALGKLGWRRYVATGEHWWQFGLTGIFAITTLAGFLTALGLFLFAEQ